MGVQGCGGFLVSVVQPLSNFPWDKDDVGFFQSLSGASRPSMRWLEVKISQIPFKTQFNESEPSLW